MKNISITQLEARLADTSDNNSNRLKFHLEINGEAFTLVFSSVLTGGGPRAAAGYWVYQAMQERQLGDTRLGIIEHDDGEGHWIAHQEHQNYSARCAFASAAAAVVYLYSRYMRRSHRIDIPRKIKTFRWSEPEQPRDLENRRVDEEARNLIQHLLEDKRVCCFEMTEINPLLDDRNKMAETAFSILKATINKINKNFS